MKGAYKMPQYNNIRKRKDGRWQGKTLVGRNPKTGKPFYKYVYANSQAECRNNLLRLEEKIELGAVHEQTKLELGTWLDKWLSDYKKAQIEQSTYENYEYNLAQVKKRIGRVYLKDLTTELLQSMFNEMREEGLTRCIKISHCLVNAALKQAVRNGMVAANVAEFVELPKQQRKEAAYLTEEEQVAFLEALESEKLAPLFMFQLPTGLRPGEVRALKWDDIDYDDRIVTISRGARRQKGGLILASTKTKRTRTIPLLDEAINVLDIQKQIQEKDKRYLGAGYCDTGLIFANNIGEIIDSSTTRKVLLRVKRKMQRLIAEEKNVPINDVTITDFTPHSLRHTFATRALEKDIPIKVVAEWLGHSTISVTGDIYSHVSDRKNKSSMQQMEGILSQK